MVERTKIERREDKIVYEDERAMCSRWPGYAGIDEHVRFHARLFQIFEFFSAYEDNIRNPKSIFTFRRWSINWLTARSVRVLQRSPVVRQPIRRPPQPSSNGSPG